MALDARKDRIGDIYKSRGQLRGSGVTQMTILLNKPYLVKVTTRGSKIPKILTAWFMDDPITKSVSLKRYVTLHVALFFQNGTATYEAQVYSTTKRSHHSGEK